MTDEERNALKLAHEWVSSAIHNIRQADELLRTVGWRLTADELELIGSELQEIQNHIYWE